MAFGSDMRLLADYNVSNHFLHKRLADKAFWSLNVPWS